MHGLSPSVSADTLARLLLLSFRSPPPPSKMEDDPDFEAMASLLEVPGGVAGDTDSEEQLNKELAIVEAVMGQDLCDAPALEPDAPAAGFAQRSAALMGYARTVKANLSLKTANEQLKQRLEALSSRWRCGEGREADNSIDGNTSSPKFPQRTIRSDAAPKPPWISQGGAGRCFRDRKKSCFGAPHFRLVY